METGKRNLPIHLSARCFVIKKAAIKLYCRDLCVKLKLRLNMNKNKKPTLMDKLKKKTRQVWSFLKSPLGCRTCWNSKWEKGVKDVRAGNPRNEADLEGTFLPVRSRQSSKKDEPAGRRRSKETSGLDQDSSTGSVLNPEDLPVVPASDLYLVEFLEKGTFGRVFLARQKDSETLLAVKIIQRDWQEEHNVAMEEMILLDNQGKAFLSSMITAIHTAKEIFFVMPCYSGGNLIDLVLSRGPLDVNIVRFLVAELVIAVGQLHDSDYLHRDIKPDNVMLDSAGHIVLGDFGETLLIFPTKKDPNCAHGCDDHIGGTYEYYAPERVKRQPYGKPSDWWAVGVVAYVLLTGKVPFGDRSDGEEQLFSNISKTVPQFHFPGVVLDFATVQLLNGLLEKDPKKRLGSGPNGMNDVLQSPFFNGIDRLALLQKQIPSPLRSYVGWGETNV